MHTHVLISSEIGAPKELPDYAFQPWQGEGEAMDLKATNPDKWFLVPSGRKVKVRNTLLPAKPAPPEDSAWHATGFLGDNGVVELIKVSDTPLKRKSASP